MTDVTVLVKSLLQKINFLSNKNFSYIKNREMLFLKDSPCFFIVIIEKPLK